MASLQRKHCGNINKLTTNEVRNASHKNIKFMARKSELIYHGMPSLVSNLPPKRKKVWCDFRAGKHDFIALHRGNSNQFTMKNGVMMKHLRTM